MDCFDITHSVFNGMTQAQLQAALTAAQQAYLDLSMGAKGVTFSYAQGEGSRSVTYTQTSVEKLSALILELQAALGMRRRARRPISFIYR